MGEEPIYKVFTEAQEQAIEQIVRRVVRQELTVSVSTNGMWINDCYEEIVAGVALALNYEDFSSNGNY